MLERECFKIFDQIQIYTYMQIKKLAIHLRIALLLKIWLSMNTLDGSVEHGVLALDVVVFAYHKGYCNNNDEGDKK